MPILYRMAVKKDNLDLLRKINEAIDKLKSSGELEKIKSKWTQHPSHPFEMTGLVKYFFYTLILFLIAILVLFLWTRLLKREVKKKSANLRQTVQEAEEANEAKSRYIVMAAHELRSPLETIQVSSRALAKIEEQGQISSDISELIKTIDISSDQLSETLNGILDHSRIEAGKTLVEETKVDLKLLTNNIFEVNRNEAIEKGLLYNFSYDITLPDFIVIDSRKLKQIVQNLIRNAIQSTPSGKSVWLRIKRVEQTFIVEVADEGVGMEEVYKTRILDDSEQNLADITNQRDNPGLGLIIVKEYVKLLGGIIHLKSQPGKGTRFKVQLQLNEAGSHHNVNFVEN